MASLEVLVVAGTLALVGKDGTLVSFLIEVGFDISAHLFVVTVGRTMWFG